MTATYAGKQSASVCVAITRLRIGIVACCWIVGLALVCQTLIWALATYTEVRFDAAVVHNAPDEAPLIVHAEPQPTPGRILPQITDRAGQASASGVNGAKSAGEVSPPAEAGSLSTYDALMGSAADLAGGAGRVAMLILLALMVVGVTLSASASIPGVERSVSAFMWTLLVAVFVLPLGGAVMLPWHDGALTTYEHITQAVDHAEGRSAPEAEAAASTSGGAPSTLVFYGRFLLFPIACLVGIALVGLQYCAGIEAAVLQRESMKLDPVLEKEAANVKPSSLHGSRSASILSRAISPSPASQATPNPTVQPGSSTPASHRRTAPAVATTIEEPVEEAPPKRLI